MRTCSECGSKMHEGYVIEDGLFYYCSDECLYKNYTEKKYLDLYNDGYGDSYYTNWEEEDEEEHEEQLKPNVDFVPTSNELFRMFDIVVHEPTRFVFKFFDFENETHCRVMDDMENLYIFPINTLKKGNAVDLEHFKKIEAKKFSLLRTYL